MKKTIMLASLLLTFFIGLPQPGYAADWYFKPAKNNQPATTEPEYQALLNKYDGIFIGDTTKKQIYMTFDNGYEAGYTPSILDTLKKENVPATFFITGHYIKSQPDLVKRMVREGHIIGNHSWGHPDLSQISDMKYEQELAKLKDAYTKLTGKPIMNYLRPPRGTFSERSMKLAKQEGYISVFWSAAYKDWVRTEQHGGAYAYTQIMRRIHPGAIVLLHTVSKDNADALPKVIHDLKKKGYQFRSLDDLVAHRMISSDIW
ncbi:delta-lactam-biosynthetic de-N-acetylase [Sporolactobacillus spathodeae]|uniref:Peptidoglycan-N-acetylmuramic acid deacetylase n=1 Tax=Sporolactobacillus spathodeae TaxID=1465502 RepID=A0ABS2Q6P6_9BACL|nr:delta-lactam-biosynthetic de-N-acetylase [Sporolactobacillus spathodeae]MBM7657464.1 peptidoglycan-N-acetylmuramic acid deacetylase [Sporolactobacillus spathodeae]